MKSLTVARFVESRHFAVAITSFTLSGSKMFAPFLATSLIRWVLVSIVESLNPLRLQSRMKLTSISFNSVALGFS